MAFKINIILFIAALLLLGVFLFVLPSDPDAPRYENRSMTRSPVLSTEDVFSGKYTNDLEAFLLDSIAYRTKFLTFSSVLEDVYGVHIGGAIRVDIGHDDLGSGMIADPDIVYREPPELGKSDAAGVTPGGADGLTDAMDDVTDETDGAHGAESSTGNEKPQTPVTEKGPSNGHVDPKEPFGVDINYNPDAVMYGDFYIDSSSVSRYIDVLNEYRRDLPQTVHMYSLLVPTHVEFLHEKYNTNGVKQISVVRSIYDKLDSGFVTVDAYNWIAAHASSEYLYFRTDHHWTAVGAYYAYLAFAEAAKIAPITIDNYIEYSFPDYMGTYGQASQNRTVLGYPDTLYYYRLDNGTTFSQSLFYIPEDINNLNYMIFMGGDHAVLDYTSTNENGKTLMIIKDSYANAFIPWVSPNYERIIVIDPRQFEGSVSKYLEGFEEIDLLILTSAFTPSLPAFVEQIAEIK